jgi:hypothetical protein
MKGQIAFVTFTATMLLVVAAHADVARDLAPSLATWSQTRMREHLGRRFHSPSTAAGAPFHVPAARAAWRCWRRCAAPL